MAELTYEDVVSALKTVVTGSHPGHYDQNPRMVRKYCMKCSDKTETEPKIDGECNKCGAFASEQPCPSCGGYVGPRNGVSHDA